MNPEELKYSEEHEWLRLDGDTAIIGITHFAQDSLGDVVFVELPEVGSDVKQFEKMGEIESVKAVSDLYCPVGGKVTEVNDSLTDSPELVNDSPYGDGWMLKVQLAGSSELERL
ncbi:MAG: glycine cleavage system protein GcvH, partial [Dehalococcoidia bacterium]|nr:glycine cleavage system protein GcvH [Dehalococcoidia bacterium]